MIGLSARTLDEVGAPGGELDVRLVLIWILTGRSKGRSALLVALLLFPFWENDVWRVLSRERRRFVFRVSP